MAEIKTGDFVIPGDFLATAEEFVPGDGAYEESGKIYSTYTGVVLVDVRTKHISVFSRALGPPALKRDDVVIGRIEDVRDQGASIYIGVLRGREDRAIPLPNMGSIHVSQVNTSYVKEMHQQFKLGDIVRARVLSASRAPVQLSTAGDDLGVIVAACSRCRAPLKREDSKLSCSECGNLEFRKLASDYRQGSL